MLMLNVQLFKTLPVPNRLDIVLNPGSPDEEAGEVDKFYNRLILFFWDSHSCKRGINCNSFSITVIWLNSIDIFTCCIYIVNENI